MAYHHLKMLDLEESYEYLEDMTVYAMPCNRSGNVTQRTDSAENNTHLKHTSHLNPANSQIGQCRAGKKLSRGNLDFEKFSYFENTNFRHKSAFKGELSNAIWM